MTYTEITKFLKRKTIGLTFFLGTTTMANAQDKQNIHGKIIDESGGGIPYASIEFNHKTNSALSNTILTDDTGNFTLDLPSGDYQIVINAVGFQHKTFETSFNVTSNMGNISLVAITHSPQEKEIEGVTITARTSTYKVELNKKIYNVDQDLSSRGGSLQDVLSNVPSVSVETDGSVSMRGNSNVKFLINGKPSSILGITDDNSNVLKSIPADQIDRIEIITNPSSKFEAEGTAGILNIILKKNKALGFNGSINGSLGYQPSSRLNTNLSWNYGKWTWFINSGGRISKQKVETSSNIFYKDTREELNMTNARKPEMKNYNLNIGFHINVTNKTSVNASFTSYNMFMEQNSSQENLSNLTGFTYRDTMGNDKNGNIQVDTSFEHKFNNKGHLLNLSGSYQDTKNNSDNDIFDNRNVTRTPYQYNNISGFARRTWIGKLDYEFPIGKNSKLEAGAKFDYQNNDITTSYAGLSNNTYVSIDDVTGVNNFTEKNTAFYAQFKSKIDKFGYQLGVRNESININIATNNSLAEQSQKNKSYNEFFPSAFLSYDLTNKSQLGINYSRRIQRPRSMEMIPVIRMQREPNRFMGNADLNPSFVNSFELSYNYARNKWNISPSLYHQKVINAISFLTEEKSYTNPIAGSVDKYILSTPYNLGTEQRYGLDLNYSINPTSWLKLFGNINMFRYKNETTYQNNIIINKGNSTMTRVTATFRLDKTLNIQWQGNYRGGQNSYNTTRKDSYAMNLGISKNLWNNAATLGLSVQDIFDSRKMKTHTDTDTFTRYAEMQWMPRQFILSFSYHFRNDNAKEQKPFQRRRDSQQNKNDDLNEGMMY